MPQEHRAIEIEDEPSDIRLRRREDDWCPVCEAWPRTTDAASPPHDPYTHRKCLTCGQTWEDHHDHTPD